VVRSGGVCLREKWAGLGVCHAWSVSGKTAAMGSGEFGRRIGPRKAAFFNIDSGVASFSLKIAKWHTRLSRGEPSRGEPAGSLKIAKWHARLSRRIPAGSRVSHWLYRQQRRRGC